MIGETLSHFRITAKLGEGGMGEVYLAEDTRLARRVAIKVLPEALGTDPERQTRFIREAKALASLSHPNIAAIHEFGEVEGRIFLVMELAAGEPLAERIARGPMPVDEACTIAVQIAEALAAAHERGFVHRDLKPGNVHVDDADQVKVLDFGLAKALEPPTSGEVAAADSPTLSVQATRAGVLLGTAAYMSPEQARGKPADQRADLWSFGVVLWEMLTGRRLFDGETVSDTLAAVLRAEIDWGELPAATPRPLRRLLRRCLERDPTARLRDAGDARLELRDALEGSGFETPTPPPRRGRELLPWGLAATFLALALVALLKPEETDRSRVATLDLLPPEGSSMNVLDGPVALSPDGNRLAAVVLFDRPARPVGLIHDGLVVRELEGGEYRELPTRTSLYDPFWSPDGRWLGFFAGDNTIKTIDPRGGPPTTLTAASDGRGATWGTGDVILFAPTADGPIYRIHATGGEPQPVTTLDTARGESAHWRPRFLPDGRRFLYLAAQGTARSSAPDRRAETGSGTVGPFSLWIGSLDGDGPRRIPGTFEAAVSYSSTGHLIYLRERTLLARSFDLDQHEWRGDATVLAESVDLAREFATPAFSISDTGVLAYHRHVAPPDTRLVWRDRDGNQLSELSLPGEARNLDLDPEGRWAAVQSRDADGNWDLWLMDLRRRAPQRFTFGEFYDAGPVFSPDGRKIAWTRGLPDRRAVVVRALTGGEETTVMQAVNFPEPIDWSPDGGLLLLERLTPDGGLWTVPVDGSAELTPFVTPSSYWVESGRFSPDGRFVAYLSDESGRFEIYVETFPHGGGKRKVSTEGGTAPRWRSDGGELYYVDLAERRLMAVPIQGSESGSFVPDLPRPLFVMSDDGYEPAPDGERFLVLEPADPPRRPATIVLGWDARLRGDD